MYVHASALVSTLPAKTEPRYKKTVCRSRRKALLCQLKKCDVTLNPSHTHTSSRPVPHAHAPPAPGPASTARWGPDRVLAPGGVGWCIDTRLGRRRVTALTARRREGRPGSRWRRRWSTVWVRGCAARVSTENMTSIAAANDQSQTK